MHFCENNCPIQSILRRILRSKALLCCYSYSCMHHHLAPGEVDYLHLQYLHTKMQKKNLFINHWVCFQTFKICIYIHIFLLSILTIFLVSFIFHIQICRPKRRTFYGNVFIRGGSMATNDPQQGRQLTLGPENKTFKTRNVSYQLVLLTCPASQYFIQKSIRL